MSQLDMLPCKSQENENERANEWFQVLTEAHVLRLEFDHWILC